MLGGGVRWLRSSERFKFMTTSLSTNAKTSYYSFCSSSANNIKNMIVDERHRQLENLDMVTAAKMLFSDPPKKRKFGNGTEKEAERRRRSEGKRKRNGIKSSRRKGRKI
ncbi:hypothetical protein JHK86_017405 [Glycine max]|nr:hypothetical protein JHK86_017405 [Glycine max]